MELASQAAGWQIAVAAALFLVCYAIIITDKINRAIIALAGALLMILLGIADMKTAYGEYIEWQTIILLAGMMLLTGIVNKSGIFQYIAIKSAQKAKGEPVRLLLMLSLLAAAGSALMDNVAMVLILVPVTLSIARALKLSPVPFLIAEILASNIGGTATLIGSAPNMMIGTAASLDFNDFLIRLAPAAVVVLAVTLLLLRIWYGAQLRADEQQKAELMKIDAAGCIKNKAFAAKSLIVLGLTLLGFLFHSLLHTEAAVVAIAGATLLMLISVKDIHVNDVFHSVEWVTVLFFAGMFVLVGGLAETGIIGKIAVSLLEMTEADLSFIAMIVLWVTGIVSATVDNIPFVAAMIPVIKEIGVQAGVPNDALNPIWWSLALGASLGGNGTLLGASANMIAAGMAGKEGKPLSFASFLKIGAPVTLLSLVISTVYVSVILL